MASSFTLDRAQRAALRGELESRMISYDELWWCFRCRDRAAVIRHLEEMTQAVAAMDTVGWQESPEAPELLSTTSSDSLAVWAATAADELAECLGSDHDVSADPDADLDALSALRSIAGTVA